MVAISFRANLSQSPNKKDILAAVASLFPYTTEMEFWNDTGQICLQYLSGQILDGLQTKRTSLRMSHHYCGPGNSERYRPDLVAISFRWKEIYGVAAIELAASNSPPDCCIGTIQILAGVQKKDTHLTVCVFFGGTGQI